MASSTRRFIFVDVFRALAIALALTAHAVNDFSIATGLATQEFVFLRLLTRAANPSFVFMFGMMLELVYARKLAEGGLAPVMPRLLWRSVQCYLGYAVTVFAGWLMGLFGTAHFVQALFFIFGGHHGNILKFYTVALLVAIPLLWFRRRFGLPVTVALCLSVWGFGPLLDWATAFHIGRFSGIRNLFLLLIPHNLTFIAAGMYVGQALRESSLSTVRRTFYRHVGWVIGGTLLVIGVLVWQSSATMVLFSYLDYYAYRTSYHIGYYAIGLLQAVTLCAGTLFLFPLRSQRLTPNSSVLAFGRSSLLAFTLGNVLLNVIVGLGATEVSPYAGLGWTIVFLAGTLVLVRGTEWGLQRAHRHATFTVLFRPADTLQREAIPPLSGWLHTHGRTLLRHSRKGLQHLKRLHYHTIGRILTTLK